MLLNCNQCHKNVNEYVCTLMYVSLTLIQDGVNDFDIGVNESIFFSFVCRMKELILIYAQKFVFSR